MSTTCPAAGNARCGTPPTSCGCASHRQCIKLYGTGAFCTAFQPGGSCNCKGNTFCALPA